MTDYDQPGDSVKQQVLEEPRFLKDLALARENYEKALVLENEHGDFQGRAATTQQLAEVAMYDHRWPDALRDFLVAQQLWRQLGSPLSGLIAPQIA